MAQQKNIWKRADVRLLAIALGLAFGSATVAQAQWLGKPGQRDVALGVTSEFTFDARGNGVKQSIDPSVGALLSFHSSYKSSRGFVLNYGYTRMNEDIEGTENNPYGVGLLDAPVSSGQADRHEFTAAYLVKSRKTFWGAQPFALAGGGALVYIPTAGYFSIYHHMLVENTQTRTITDLGYVEKVDVSSETRPAGLFGVGIDWDTAKHWGGRLEYRALAFLAPSFQQWDINSHGYTLSQAPTLSIYYKF